MLPNPPTIFPVSSSFGGAEVLASSIILDYSFDKAIPRISIASRVENNGQSKFDYQNQIVMTIRPGEVLALINLYKNKQTTPVVMNREWNSDQGPEKTIATFFPEEPFRVSITKESPHGTFNWEFKAEQPEANIMLTSYLEMTLTILPSLACYDNFMTWKKSSNNNGGGNNWNNNNRQSNNNWNNNNRQQNNNWNNNKPQQNNWNNNRPQQNNWNNNNNRQSNNNPQPNNGGNNPQPNHQNNGNNQPPNNGNNQQFSGIDIGTDGYTF